MAIQIQGNGGTVAEVDGTTFRAQRVTSRPIDHGALGHYKLSTVTGAMAAGAATRTIFYLRWTDASRLCVITKLSIDGLIATTAFAAGQILVRAWVARAFTAENGTPGGTALTLTGHNAKQRTGMGSALMGVARVATTAGLADGTWALDSNSIGLINTHSSGGVGSATPIIGSIYLPKFELLNPDGGDGEHPLVLAQNEGLIVQVTVPATGVWTAGVSTRWAEVAAY